jgi:hypothetical protein
MWLATKHGFYSIIQKEQGVYYVRARVRKDLENLLQVSGVEHEVHSWPTADYRYRIIIGPEDLLKVVVALTATLDYPNFKSSVAQQVDQRDKLSAYHEIWATMSDFQREEAVR